MSKRIEPGCLVVVKNADDPKLLGLSGVAKGKMPARKMPLRLLFAGFVYWDVEGSDHWHREDCLLRIDDYDASADETQQDREVTA